jgi:hypothetical protein
LQIDFPFVLHLYHYFLNYNFSYLNNEDSKRNEKLLTDLWSLDKIIPKCKDFERIYKKYCK